MDGFRIPLGEWAEVAVAAIRDNLSWLLRGISDAVGWLVGSLADLLLSAPIVVVIVVAALLGWALRSWKFAIGTAISFAIILGVGQWVTAMQTLALVLIATVIAVVIAVPLGILAARSDRFSAVIKPVLDLMQAMPGFVYLIPAIVFFSIGFVPGLVATVIFALPPGVRLTELGIRGVDAETVEAGHAFGATPGQILRGVQLPLAMPTIMTGVNQVIMLALSMAVIAGIAGAPGLGKEIVQAMSTVNIGTGVEAGLSVVILAIYLDRLTSALGDLRGQRGSLVGEIGRRRAAAAAGQRGLAQVT
ncbi:ABC transporter permease [Microbacterium imperiale]|uniref:Glycine/betaine ABC transporter permease n=1 Tax=Microbacterium imperiale TaxID=33884 RepID=A0A9W6HHY6_9MICO|nr:ABC transporter permease subunit [Microbacterium imperiale]MBP2421111.1 glycine betaine/proline transport system permease protein [Microbacterium imperiale]MDS0199777.1 ABC transporter permease subunit [Microbacterium imperiale]BFE41452.1 proline/glycine betaine ABC transporter permease [Microbacterium imperiale]GLJ80403.1 glycine/betaine ABC transporter permease [Microbacterium imperiale]